MKLISYRKEHGKWILRIEHGHLWWKREQEYVGDGTVWSAYPEFSRCGTVREAELSEIWNRILHEERRRAEYERAFCQLDPAFRSDGSAPYNGAVITSFIDAKSGAFTVQIVQVSGAYQLQLTDEYGEICAIDFEHEQQAKDAVRAIVEIGQFSFEQEASP